MIKLNNRISNEAEEVELKSVDHLALVEKNIKENPLAFITMDKSNNPKFSYVLMLDKFPGIKEYKAKFLEKKYNLFLKSGRFVLPENVIWFLDFWFSHFFFGSYTFQVFFQYFGVNVGIGIDPFDQAAIW